jgi:hypothetical protein
MARKKPNINVETTQLLRDRQSFKDFVLKINTDTFTYSYSPNIISVENDIFFTLTLLNKKFVFDILQVDDVRDYVDVYLFGVKQPADRYNVQEVETNIIVTFTADITRLPNEVSASDFEIKGKIAEIV